MHASLFGTPMRCPSRNGVGQSIFIDNGYGDELHRGHRTRSPSVRYMRHHCTQKTSYLRIADTKARESFQTEGMHSDANRDERSISPLRLWAEVLQPHLKEVDCSVRCRELPASDRMSRHFVGRRYPFVIIDVSVSTADTARGNGAPAAVRSS